MRLLTGLPGSGKTAFVLDSVRAAMRTGDAGVRLLVPTATMAQHLQNTLAREGLVFRRTLIQTLNGFVESLAGETPQVSDAVLYLLVDEAARRVNRPEFARVVRLPGFSKRLAGVIGDFSSAGCDSARLAACLPDAPLAEAFLQVYGEVDRELDRRGLEMRGRRLERVAGQIERDGLGPIHTVWMDGFHALPDPELRVIGAIGKRAALTLTFAATDDRLQAMGFQEERLARGPRNPAIQVVCAPGIEREVEEIARRILEQHAAGRPFREIGIIVRSKEVYVPILRSTLERFGIPARFYFEPDMDQHPAIRFLRGAVDAMLGGWDHESTFAALRLAPRFAGSNTMDRFDFAVREQIPGAGLGALKALTGDDADRLSHLIDAFGEIEEWRSFVLAPKAWAQRLRILRNLFRPDPAGPADVLRGQASALDQFDAALDEAASAFDRDRLLEPAEFWPAVTAVLRLTPLRLRDGRREVVHVISAHEARQWSLPVVFVCGLVEKQFPQFHRQDPFFPDSARRRLNAAGIRVRTAAESEDEERALFDSAISRASMLVVLTYPQFDARGEENLPSLFLEGLPCAREAAHLARPMARIAYASRPPVEIRDPALLGYLAAKSTRLSPTRLESFLQCPFQHFAGRVMKLQTAPPLPEERLDFLTQGNIVHEVLAAWWNEPRDIVPLFDQVFSRCCEEKRIPWRYHTERLRNAMLQDLQAFAADTQWPRAGFVSRTEEKFVFPLAPGIEISGRIDRLDQSADGRAYVIDYKYSAQARVKARRNDENLLQAPLYMLAAERALGVTPSGMFYVGVKGGVYFTGWSGRPVASLQSVELDADWREIAEKRTLAVVSDIRSGRIEASPADVDNCRFCDYRDVCRVQFSVEEPEEIAEGEGA